MDIAWDALAELDIVIGSVHSHMSLEPEAMTDRLLRALECPHLKALGHPTGRLLLHRDPFTFDFDKVISEAVRRGVWLEVNSSPERLDLSANHVRAAKAKGAKFIVSTDAHHPKHLLNMRYGILTARRGGLEAGDIINTYPAEQFVQAELERETRRVMATATLISVEEYLATSYRPDRELIDGQLVERNLGEYDHSRLQTKVAGWFLNREREWNIRVVVEQRVQVKPEPVSYSRRVRDFAGISRLSPSSRTRLSSA